ncbi:cornifelin homolog [Rhinophrynus dorsalis]
MSVVTQQPARAPSGALIPTGDWNSRLFDCCEDCGICLFGFFFPTCLSCYVAHKYGENCLLPCVPGGLAALRTHIRLSYGISGSVCNDALLMCFCGCCENCRMAREVRYHSPS